MKTKRLVLALLLSFKFLFGSPAVSTVAADDSRLKGYTPESAATELRWEKELQKIPDPESAREHLKRLTMEPHVAGTKADYATAIYVRDKLRSYGLPAELKEYEVLLPYPKAPSVVELVAPRRETLPVKEAEIPDDPSSRNPDIIPLFNGYSASGDVTASLVYVNYGLPSDYDALAKLGVNLKGKIAIARYGNSFRGVKAKVAEEHGAVGVLIYSDPADDGYVQGDVYPKGPWRPSTSAQRGSVQYLFEYPGDPLTPGKPSIPGVPRLKIEEATDLPRIPVQPISYGDAARLLEPLRGQLRPKGFQGGLPFAYHVGDTNDVQVHLKTEMDFQTRKIWDVITSIEGTDDDQWIVMGNHRDAWTFGAVDPNSGTTAMLEVGRALGQLYKNGWRPGRTIVMCSWDGEEYGLLGSTEWAEEEASELTEKAVAYLNVDAAVSGPNFGASSVPTLWNVIRDVTKDIKDPKTGKTVYAQWQDRFRELQPVSESAETTAAAPSAMPEAKIGALGSGSDYTPFLQHLGIASADMSFGGDYGVYHSAYDNFYWMSKFGDPTFAYHVTCAQLWGTLAMRLADADVLPLDYSNYATEIKNFYEESVKTAHRRNLDKSFDQKAMEEALEDFSKEAARVEKSGAELLTDRARAHGEEINRVTSKIVKFNKSLMAAERAFVDERGLHGRSWYRHEIYAPGYYTGYAAQPLPDFRQGLEDRDAAATKEGLARIVAAIQRSTSALRSARD